MIKKKDRNSSWIRIYAYKRNLYEISLEIFIENLLTFAQNLHL